MAQEKPVTSRGVAARMLKFTLFFTDGLKRVGSQDIEGDLRVLASLEDDLLWGEFLFAQMLEVVDSAKAHTRVQDDSKMWIFKTRRDMTVDEVLKTISIRRAIPLTMPDPHAGHWHVLRRLMVCHPRKVLLLGEYHGRNGDYPFIEACPREIVGWLKPSDTIKKGTSIAAISAA